MQEPRGSSRSLVPLVAASVLVLVACGGSGTPSASSGGASASGSMAASPSGGQPSDAPSAAPSVAATVPPTPSPSDGSTTGQVRTDAFGVEQVWVPAGSFTMGTDKAAIAKLAAESPPDWVASELAS